MCDLTLTVFVCVEKKINKIAPITIIFYFNVDRLVKNLFRSGEVGLVVGMNFSKMCLTSGK